MIVFFMLTADGLEPADTAAAALHTLYFATVVMEKADHDFRRAIEIGDQSAAVEFIEPTAAILCAAEVPEDESLKVGLKARWLSPPLPDWVASALFYRFSTKPGLGLSVFA